jgi:hypothetical protein
MDKNFRTAPHSARPRGADAGNPHVIFGLKPGAHLIGIESCGASRSPLYRAGVLLRRKPSATHFGRSPSNCVANQRAAKPVASKAVFVNCPFDEEFKPIFRAMTFAVISSGYNSRCALDATDGAEIRVSKIATMIGECDC